MSERDSRRFINIFPRSSHEYLISDSVTMSKSIKQDAWWVDRAATQQIASAFQFGCKDDPKVGGAAAEMGIIEFATQSNVEQALTCDKNQFVATLQGLKQPCPSGDASCHHSIQKAFTLACHRFMLPFTTGELFIYDGKSVHLRPEDGSFTFGK